MVSYAALVLSLLCSDPAAQQNINQYKVLARRVLERAYSDSSASLPPDLLGPEEPEIRSNSGNGVLVVFGGGSVGFSQQGTPNYISCYLKAPALKVPMSPAAIRERAANFVKEFRPGWPLQLEVRRNNSILVRLMEDGVPHFHGGWLQIDGTTGSIINGGLPALPPKIARRPSKKVSKESVIAEAVQTALERNPELQVFEIERARAYWYVPEYEFSSAPDHAKSAAREKTAIKIYAVGLIAEREDEGLKSRKNGMIFVDVETGRAISGGVAKIESAPTGGVPPLKSISRPERIYVNSTWQLVTSSKAVSNQASVPEGQAVYACQGSTVVMAKFDIKKKLLWVPSSGLWKGLQVTFRSR